MHKNAFWLLSIIGLFYFASANAEVAISIQNIESQVWLQRGDARSELQLGSLVKSGEVIVTGSQGQVALQLGKTTLKVSSDARVSFSENSDDNTRSTELHVYQGGVCVQYRTGLNSDNQFKLNIGETMFITMSYSGDICASRLDSQSSIELLLGSAQVTHFVDPNLIILSQSGTAFSIEDNGSYKLTVPGVDKPLISEAIVIEKQETEQSSEDNATIEVEQVALAKPVDENQSSESALVLENASADKTVNSAEAVTTPEAEVEKSQEVAEKDQVTKKIEENKEEKADKQENLSDEMLATIDAYIEDTPAPPEDEQIIEPIEKPGPVETNSKPVGVYTVYLFSTRSQEVAEKANRKFQKAKQNTQIITNNQGSETRYRVAVTGFTTLKAAQDYADSVIGKLDIKDTWIGKQ